jgi:SSS family solute:Na+ symporter
LIVVWGILGILSAFYVASTGEDLAALSGEVHHDVSGAIAGDLPDGGAAAQGECHRRILSAPLPLRRCWPSGSGFGWLSFPGIWQSAITAPIAVILGLLISLFGAPPPERSLQGLTLRHQGNQATPLD